MIWNKEKKDKLSYIFAGAAFIAGWGLTIAGFIVAPLGIVDDSVLWILGQALVFTGSVIGITMHVNNVGAKIKEDLEAKIDSKLKSDKK